MRSCTGRKRDEPISHHQLKYAHAPFGRPDAKHGIGDPQKALSTTVPLLARTGTSKSIVRFDTVSRVAARFLSGRRTDVHGESCSCCARAEAGRRKRRIRHGSPYVRQTETARRRFLAAMPATQTTR